MTLPRLKAQAARAVTTGRFVLPAIFAATQLYMIGVTATLNWINRTPARTPDLVRTKDMRAPARADGMAAMQMKSQRCLMKRAPMPARRTAAMVMQPEGTLSTVDCLEL